MTRRAAHPPAEHRGTGIAALVGIAVCAGLVLGLLGRGVLVRQSSAGSTPTTANGPNSWTLGSVTLGDDAGGAALFSATDLLPGSSGSNCITVRYTGDVTASVRLYAADAADGSNLGQYVGLTVEQGTGGGFGSCAAFTAESTIFSGTLSRFDASMTDHDSGVGRWTPNAPASKVYRISYTLDAATPDDAQDASISTTFRWESQA